MMMLAIALAAACPHAFAPPIDAPMTVTTREERRLGESTYGFTLVRQLGFTRGADGLTAELTLTSLQTDAPGPIAAALEAGEGALRNVPIRWTWRARQPTSVRVAKRCSPLGRPTIQAGRTWCG